MPLVNFHKDPRYRGFGKKELVDSRADVRRHINCILGNLTCVHLSTTRVHHTCTPVRGRAKGKRFTVKLQPWTAFLWQCILPQSIDARCSLSVITAWRCISYKELVESGWLTGYSYIPYTTGGPITAQLLPHPAWSADNRFHVPDETTWQGCGEHLQKPNSFVRMLGKGVDKCSWKKSWYPVSK